MHNHTKYHSNGKTIAEIWRLIDLFKMVAISHIGFRVWTTREQYLLVFIIVQIGFDCCSQLVSIISKF